MRRLTRNRWGPRRRALIALACGAAAAGCLAAFGGWGDPPPSATAREDAPIEIDLSGHVPSPGEEIVALGWGDGPGEVGLSSPGEGLLHGPEALLVRPDGRMAVLDSVNGRVLVVGKGGEVEREIAVPLTQPRFLAAEGARLYVLDPDVDRSVCVLPWKGGVEERIHLPVLPQPATGLFVRGGEVYVELSHYRVHKVPRNDGKSDVGRAQTGGVPEGGHEALPAEIWTEMAPTVPGRPVAGESDAYVRAGFDAGRARVRLADAEGSRELYLSFSPSLEQVVCLDGPRANEVVIGGRLDGSEDSAASAEPTADQPTDRFALVRAAVGGAPRVSAPLVLESRSGIYLGPPCVPGPDGFVYQPVADEDSFRILRHSLSFDGEEARS